MDNNEILEHTKYTPWGGADQQHLVADGIVIVGTPSHGGVYLSPERNARIPDYMRRGDDLLTGGWYEEDCEASIPHFVFAVEFVEFYNDDLSFGPRGTLKEFVAASLETIKQWYPSHYELLTEFKLKPGESHTNDRRLFTEAHREDWVTVSASGDWHPDVSPGHVGVVAKLGGDRDSRDSRWFQVRTDDYRDRGTNGYVIGTNAMFEIETVVGDWATAVGELSNKGVEA